MYFRCRNLKGYRVTIICHNKLLAPMRINLVTRLMYTYKYRYIVSRAYWSPYALDCIHMADATLLYGKSVCCDYTYIYIIIQGFMTLIFSYQHQMLVLNLMSSRRRVVRSTCFTCIIYCGEHCLLYYRCGDFYAREIYSGSSHNRPSRSRHLIIINIVYGMD